jgi:hypothetical protein
MRSIVLSCMPLFFCTILSHITWQTARFSKKKLPTKCVFWFSKRFIWYISHSKNNSARYFHYRPQVFLLTSRYFCQISIKRKFLIQFFFRKTIRYQIKRKSFQWESSCSMWADRQTDNVKLIIAFLSVANMPKICIITKFMHCWFLVYSIKLPLHVSGINSPSSGGKVCVCIWQVILLGWLSVSWQSS